MARKTTLAPIPPPAPKRGNGRSFNLYVQGEDLQEFDAIVDRMGGTRSDAFRWLLSLARGPARGAGKEKSPSSP